MRDNCFLDTNIFIYSFDDREPDKRGIASGLIQKGLKEHQTFISFQVVQEFINVSTRKFQKPLSAEDCKLYIRTIMMPLWKIYPSKELYTSALDIARDYQFSFYDSLIISAAIESSANILYSEDLQHNQKVGTVTIINPFISG